MPPAPPPRAAGAHPASPRPVAPRAGDDPAGAYLPTRRRFIAAGCCVAAAATTLYSTSAAAAPWAAACTATLPEPSRALLEAAWQGLDPAALWDMHCHLLGNGDSGSGCWLHESLTGGFHLVERLRRRVILDAACVDRAAPSVDRAYVERLLALAEGFPAGARWMLFAFDRAHDERGRADPARSTLYVPDAYAQQVARAHPQRFEWVASIHPYREDAIAALEAAAAAGARAVKWLPSAMAIDLRDGRSVRFGERAAALGLPLVVHVGEERAVPGAGRAELVNPLHARALLERGARVVMAHCASLGEAVDHDRRSGSAVPAFELFARMMGERAHEGRLFGDLSAVFQVNRSADVWRTLLEREEWHARLLQGSDYPLPGLKVLTSLARLRRAGLLDDAQADALAPLREAHPLLFDFALKRTLRSGGRGFAGAVFATRRHFVPG